MQECHLAWMACIRKILYKSQLLDKKFNNWDFVIFGKDSHLLFCFDKSLLIFKERC